GAAHQHARAAAVIAAESILEAGLHLLGLFLGDVRVDRYLDQHADRAAILEPAGLPLVRLIIASDLAHQAGERGTADAVVLVVDAESEVDDVFGRDAF